MPVPLTEQAQTLMRKHIVCGDVVIDATAGNGYDTLLLAERVGKTGKVFAFDNQITAIESARARLIQAGLDQQVTWLGHGHEEMAQHISNSLHGRIKAIMFNLGYLPCGAKSHTTQKASTLAALEQACTLLSPGGVLSIVAYTGHPGGRDETEAIKQWAMTCTKARTDITIPESKNNNAPEWVVLYKD